MPCACVWDEAVAEPSNWALPRNGSAGLAGRLASDLVSTHLVMLICGLWVPALQRLRHPDLTVERVPLARSGWPPQISERLLQAECDRFGLDVQ